MRIRVDGRTAHLNPTQHLDLTLAGLVHLDGPGWGRELPVITWTAPCGTRTELRGFTSDPVVWLLQLRLDAEANRPDPAVGPVEVPCPDAAYRRWLREMDQPAMQPSPILLLDLNYTLAESRHGDRRPMAERVASETYRGWLVEVARMHTTVLITARPSRWGVATLARIEASTGWRPDLACFNDARLAPPEAKARALDRHVLPRFGVDPGLYLGLESNPATREMYARRGIASVEARSPSIVAGALAAWMARNAAPRP
jgi:hypothetical protein